MSTSDPNLPAQPTPFIGRREELAEIGALLEEANCRLLTLAGPGGIGKTRLAIQAAILLWESFPDGVYFTPLQPVSSIDFLVSAIAEAVRLSFHASENPRQQLLNALGKKRALLILDNFEHLLEAAELISEILAAAPQLKVLVTSREVLDLQEEFVRQVAGLSYPADAWLDDIDTYSAVELFTERARRIQPGFSLARDRQCVARICQLVQGMPLALELAAAWLSSLPCAEIAAEIQNNLDFLASAMRNVPERHRNLRAVFEQSWKMLSARQQGVFKRLSVFQGGFERPAAHFVAGADLASLHALVDKSLLRITPAGRYEIHEVLRQFAHEKLAERPAEHGEARQKHCDYYAAFLEKKEAELKGLEQAGALAAIEGEIDNLRLAWRSAVEGNHESAIRQCMGSLLIFYHARAYFEEGAAAFHGAVSAWEGRRNFDAPHAGALLGDLYLHEAWFEAIIGRGPAAVYLYEKGLAFIPGGKWQRTTPMALVAINFLSWMVEKRAWTKEQAHAVFREVLAGCERAGDAWGAAWMHYSLGLLAYYEDKNPQECARLMQVSAEGFRQIGDLWASTFPLHHLAEMYSDTGKFFEARGIFHETLAICRQVGDVGGVEFALGQLSSLAAHEHDFAQSWQYLMDAIQVAYSIQRDLSMTFHLFNMGELLSEVGYKERAVEIYAFLLKFNPYESAREYVLESLEALRKQLPPVVFESARQRGAAYEYKTLVESLAKEFAQPARAGALPALPESASPAGLPGAGELVEALSPRELEVLGLVAAGLSNGEIARKLVVTEGTVKKHLNNIFGKLQVKSRIQAATRARELRLLP